MTKTKLNKLKEKIAKLINHGLNDHEIAAYLTEGLSGNAISIIRDLMTQKPTIEKPLQLLYTKKEIDNNKGGGGLEIKIEGCKGDPTDSIPGTAVFIENYKGKVLCHIWDGTQQDCHTHTLKQYKTK